MSLEKFYYRRNDEEMKKIGENDSCTIKKDIYKYYIKYYMKN